MGILPRTINILFNSFKDKNYKRANLKPKMFCDVVKLSSIQEEREDSKKKMLLSLSDVPVSRFLAQLYCVKIPFFNLGCKFMTYLKPSNMLRGCSVHV